MREFLSIAADIATIVTAICATGFVIKINIDNSTAKRAVQKASGTSNSQTINQ